MTHTHNASHAEGTGVQIEAMDHAGLRFCISQESKNILHIAEALSLVEHHVIPWELFKVILKNKQTKNPASHNGAQTGLKLMIITLHLLNITEFRI